ncbi:MAG: DNA replication/repair protein RecF [Deltaproteobacteria bacterium]|nr:DNA replication/repair protein RecF [Deltaproteobacteria bacterium]
MRLTSLSLRDFRNLAVVDLELPPGISVFFGDNGQGKTNLLEAVYLLATLKSFRGAKNKELIRFEHVDGKAKKAADCAVVKGRLLTGSLPRDYQVTVDDKGKRIRVDGKDPRGLPNYFSGIKAVSFVPSDLRMVDGGPELRREFLDRAAFTLDSTYLGVAREYRTALRQKNALLRDGKRTGRSPDPALLGVWNDRLVSAGTEVIARRVGFLERFAPTFRGVHEGITGAAKGYAEIRYRGPVTASALEDGREGIAAALKTKVDDAFAAEVKRGFSTVGPHRDDWELRVGGEPLRAFGSQGQVRSAALAMRMAVMELTKEAAGVCPLFLLDDVSSELDSHRNRQLMDRLRALEAQVLVTTTSLSNLQLTRARMAAFRVQGGVVESQPSEGS